MKQKTNEAGETIEEFLKNYNANKYPKPSLTADIVVVTPNKKVLLIKRKNHPSIGEWCLPGGFVDFNESSYVAAQRELKEETGVCGVSLQSVGFFCEPTRDPRTRIVSRTYFALEKESKLQIKAADDAQNADLFEYSIEKHKIVSVPQPTKRVNQITLPCTSEGEPLPEFVQKYKIVFHNKKENITLKSCVGLCQNENCEPLCVLLPCDEGETGIVFDHALAIFKVFIKLKQV